MSIRNYNTIIEDYQTTVMVIELKHRNIICIPTMLGCPIECTFCISRHNTFLRNITALEMIELANKGLCNVDKSKHTLLSFTGEGEPLLNLKHVNAVMEAMEDDTTIDAFRIVTSGIKPRLLSKVYKPTKDLHLQFSMHSPFDEIRTNLIPRTAELKDIYESINENSKTFSEIAVNYVLMKGVNDRVDDFLQINEDVNKDWIIKLNPLLETDKYQPSERIEIWGDILKHVGFDARVFSTVGSTIKNSLYGDLTYRPQAHNMAQVLEFQEG